MKKKTVPGREDLSGREGGGRKANSNCEIGIKEFG